MERDDEAPEAAWTIIIPVKDTSLAKTRLSDLSQPDRATLALAFASDTVVATLTCPAVRSVLVVTNDERAGAGLAALGARVVADRPDSGLNPALRHGVDLVRRDDPRAAVAAMSGDLPALRPEDLTAAFGAGSGHGRWFVADADGTGTTLLAVTHGESLNPWFGPGSRQAHRRSGAVEVSGWPLPGLRRDVDTVEDLVAAKALGVGSFTQRALAGLELAGPAFS